KAAAKLVARAPPPACRRDTAASDQQGEQREPAQRCSLFCRNRRACAARLAGGGAIVARAGWRAAVSRLAAFGYRASAAAAAISGAASSCLNRTPRGSASAARKRATCPANDRAA